MIPGYLISVLQHGWPQHLMLRLCFCSGEWCVNAGEYAELGALNRTQFDALNTSTANSPRCNRLTHATCFRSRDTLGKAFAAAQAQDVKKLVSNSVQVGLLLFTLCHWAQKHNLLVTMWGYSCCCCLKAVRVVLSDARSS